MFDRIQILDRARVLADAMLPDPSVIAATEDALQAAESVVAGAELECASWGETLDYRGRTPCPEELLPELRAAVLAEVQRRIAWARVADIELTDAEWRTIAIVRTRHANGRTITTIMQPRQARYLFLERCGGMVGLEIVQTKRFEPLALLRATQLFETLATCRDEKKRRKVALRVRRILSKLPGHTPWARDQARLLRQRVQEDARRRRFPRTPEQWISDITWMTRRRPEFGWQGEASRG
jgi:hypothetical protein